MTSSGVGAARPRRRWLWLLLGFAVVAWMAAVGLAVLRVDSHIRDGQAAVSEAQRRLDATTISDPHSPDLLAPVVADFGAARRDLDSPLLLPVRLLPIAGRQVRAARNLAAAAEQVGSIGQVAISQARAALQAPHASGPDRLAAISALATAAGRADARLARVSLGSRTALVGFVQGKYDDFQRRLDKVRTGVHKGALAAGETAKLLRGPSHVLLLASNNAEMRNGSGMFLSAAQMDIADGKVTIGAVFHTSELVLPPGAVPLTGGYASVWGPYLANEEWRNLAMSARFDETAAMAAQMWRAKTGQQVDAVLAIDIGGLQALLVGTGPVTSEGRAVTADGVAQLLMHDQYLAETGAPAASQARAEALGGIADAVVQAVQRGGFDTAAVAKLLPTVVAGRHLMLWSAAAPTEAAWQAVGVAGTLGGHTLLAAVQNVGVNKLDEFLTVSTDVDVVPGAPSNVTAVFHMANHTPVPQPSYIAGTGIAGVPPDTYLALATLTMPGDASHVLVDGKPIANNSGLDGATRVVAALRRIAPGAQTDLTITFSLPGAHGQLQVESAGRLPSATLRVVTPGTSLAGGDDRRPLLTW